MRVLAQRPGGWQLGHAVLAHKGMVAWIGAWTTLAPAPAVFETSVASRGSTWRGEPRSMTESAASDRDGVRRILLGAWVSNLNRWFRQ